MFTELIKVLRLGLVTVVTVQGCPSLGLVAKDIELPGIQHGTKCFACRNLPAWVWPAVWRLFARHGGGVTAWGIPRALWAAPGGAAWYNRLWPAINNNPFQVSNVAMGAISRSGAAQLRG